MKTEEQFSVFDGKLLIMDFKNTYICMTGDISLVVIASHVYLHCSGKEYRRVAESKMLFTIASTEKCKIQELQFEKALTLPLKKKKK